MHKWIYPGNFIFAVAWWISIGWLVATGTGLRGLANVAIVRELATVRKSSLFPVIKTEVENIIFHSTCIVCAHLLHELTCLSLQLIFDKLIFCRKSQSLRLRDRRGTIVAETWRTWVLWCLYLNGAPFLRAVDFWPTFVCVTFGRTEGDNRSRFCIGWFKFYLFSYFVYFVDFIEFFGKMWWLFYLSKPTERLIQYSSWAPTLCWQNDFSLRFSLGFSGLTVRASSVPISAHSPGFVRRISLLSCMWGCRLSFRIAYMFWWLRETCWACLLVIGVKEDSWLFDVRVFARNLDKKLEAELHVANFVQQFLANGLLMAIFFIV